MTVGIYCIINTINNKKWIGQSWNIEKRLAKHKRLETSPHLRNAISKYGWNNFEKSIILILGNQEELDRCETKLIEIYNTRDRNFGYNLKEGGRGGKHAEESKQKIRKNNKGKKKPKSEEHRRKISNTLKGNIPWNKGLKTGPKSKEQKQKQSKSMTGRIVSKKTKQLMNGNNNGSKPCIVDGIEFISLTEAKKYYGCSFFKLRKYHTVIMKSKG